MRCGIIAMLLGALAEDRYGVQPLTGSPFASIARCHHPESETARALHCDSALHDGALPAAVSTCGLCGQSPAAAYLAEVARALRRLKEQLEAERALELVQTHGRCFFRFVLAGDLQAALNASASGAGALGGDAAAGAAAAVPVADAPSMDRLHFLVPLDASRLPFRGNRRNVKVLKMLGQLFFPWAQRLLWIDTKLHVGTVDPLEYYRRARSRALLSGISS